MQGHAVRVRIVGPVVDGSHRDHRARPDEERHAGEAVLLAHPARPGHRAPGEEVGPGALRHVVRHLAVVGEDRRDQQVRAEHVLPFQMRAAGVVRELQEHRAHHRDALRVCGAGSLVQIGHEAQLQPGEQAQDVHGLLVEEPGDPVGGAAVQAAVRGEQAEGEPPFEQGRCRGALEAADVVAPVAEPGEAERQAAAQRLGHRLVGRLAVAAPVHGELLAAGGRRAREDDGLRLAAVLAQHVEDGPVVEVGVVVVHPLGVAAVRVRHVERDPLPEVGLEAVDALREQRLQLRRVPVTGGRTREVDQCHARLPQVPLPDAAVRPLQQVPEGLALREQR